MTLALRERPSPNHDSRGEAIGGPPRIDMLVLHYTGMQSAAAALDRLCDPAARVSSHYVVDEDGTMWRLVPEERRAWHAGVSYWQGETGAQHRLDRRRDRQSRSRMGLSRLSRAADGGG